VKPRLLDLCCCAGGMAMGYHRAGFDVTGVDTAHQPNYPFSFIRSDALEYLVEYGHEYDVVHASWPCQSYLNLGAVNRALGRTYEHPDLIAVGRELLVASGKPYVIENVEDAKGHLVDPVRICGTGLDLPIRRHRLFESNIELAGIACQHGRFTEKKYWTGWRPNGETRLSSVVQIYGNAGGREHWPAALGGVDWMTAKEMTECVPPAYAEHIGRQLMAHLSSEVAA
jgi:DNA (cytosine-5)-methyltransferase 1